jgi:hypothetical protein
MGCILTKTTWRLLRREAYLRQDVETKILRSEVIRNVATVVDSGRSGRLSA